MYIFFFNKSLKTKSLCLSKWGILERVSKTFKTTIKEKNDVFGRFSQFLTACKIYFLVRERNVTWVFCLLIRLIVCYQNTATKSFSSISFSNCFAPRIWKKVLHLKWNNSILRSSDNQETTNVGLDPI